MHAQARSELAGWQQQVSDAAAQSEASAAALAAAQRQAEELQRQLGEAQQGSARLKSSWLHRWGVLLFGGVRRCYCSERATVLRHHPTTSA